MAKGGSFVLLRRFEGKTDIQGRRARGAVRQSESGRRELADPAVPGQTAATGANELPIGRGRESNSGARSLLQGFAGPGGWCYGRRALCPAWSKTEGDLSGLGGWRQLESLGVSSGLRLSLCY